MFSVYFSPISKYSMTKRKRKLSDYIADVVLKKRIPNTGMVNFSNMVYGGKIKYYKMVKIHFSGQSSM